MRHLFLCILTIATCMYGGIAKASDIREEVIHVLETAETVTVYSLQTSSKTSPAMDRLYRFPVLGAVRVTNEEANDAVRAFLTAIKNGGHEALCFKPRHALRVVVNGHIYDYLLCYECQSMEIIKDGNQELGTLEVSGSPMLLNNILKTHHIKLSS